MASPGEQQQDRQPPATSAADAALRQLQAAHYQAELLGNIVRALELAAQAYEQHRADSEARFHLKQLIRSLGARLRPHHDVDSLSARLTLPPGVHLEARDPPAEAAAEPPTVAAHVLLVDVDGSGEAFVAEFGVEPCEASLSDKLPPGCGPAFAEAVHSAELAVLRFLKSRHRLQPDRTLLEGKRFFLSGPRAADVFVTDGQSIGAAAAVVLYALWAGERVPADLLFTGGLDADGSIKPVASVPAKLRAAFRERPKLRYVLIPAAAEEPGLLPDRDRVSTVATLASLLEQTFGSRALEQAPPAAVNVEGTLRMALELYEKINNFPAALELLEAVHGAILKTRQAGDPEAYRGEEFTCLWRIGSCLEHAGEVRRAMDCFDRAKELGEQLWEREEIEPSAFFGFRGNLALLLRDSYRFAEAERLLLDTLDRQKQLRQSKRERAKTLGNLGELYTIVGRFSEAEQALRQSLGFLRSTYPDEVPRSLCYLGNLQLRQGRHEGALALYEEGLTANREVQYGRAANGAFLSYGVVRSLCGLGRCAAAVQRADVALAELPLTHPFPRQLILKHRGLAKLRLGDGGGVADLRAAADLTYARGSLLRYGLSTALGELALHQLSAGAGERGAHELVVECAGRLAAAMRAVSGLDPAQSGLAAIEAILQQPPPLDAGGLAEPLRLACRYFFY